LIMLGLQVFDYFDCFVLSSGDGVNVGEIGVECPTVSGKRDRSLKRCDCFIVHVLLRERLANPVGRIAGMAANPLMLIGPRRSGGRPSTLRTTTEFPLFEFYNRPRTPATKPSIEINGLRAQTTVSSARQLPSLLACPRREVPVAFPRELPCGA
jgi:hypothetical protein